MPPSSKGLKRTLPRPIASLAIDEEETCRETFPEEAHAVTRALRDGLEKHDDATEAVVHVVGGHETDDGMYVTLDCFLTEAAVSRLFGRLVERNVVRPFERRSVVHTYHIDSKTYAVENLRGAVKIRCWEERCCELEVLPALSAAISFQRRDNTRPHSFSSRSDVHNAEVTERLAVDMGGSTWINVDLLDGGGRACLTHRRTTYKFPYKAVCRAATCLLAAAGGA